MMTDARSLKPGSVRDADICIIGAGAAGITLAKAFAGGNLRVVVLESGGLDIEADTEALNQGEVETPLFGPLEGARLRFFGGTTNHWAGYCAPLEPLDFSVRPWVEHSGWPITPEALQPDYRPALDVLELPPEVMAYKPRERDLHYADTEVKYRFINHLRFGRVYRAALQKAENIDIVLHANLVALDDGKTPGHVASITAATLTGVHFKVRARRFILACGALENTRLLLAAIGQPFLAAVRQYDWLGKCFMQHPHIDVATTLYFDHPWYSKGFEDHLGPTAAYQRDKKLLNYTLGLDDYRHSLWDDVEVPQYLKRIRPPRGSLEQTAQIKVRSEQAPRRENQITLSNKTDALGMPRMKVQWGLGEQDIRTITDGAMLIARVLGANNQGIVRLSDWVQAGKLPDYVWGGHHHMGTTRMSQSPQDGVVDTDCRVHGTDNLYVAGSGVFPTSGWANPTFTIIALALRLADHLKAGPA